MPSDRLLLAEHKTGATYAELAAKYQLNADGIRGRVSRAYRAEIASERPTYVFAGQEQHGLPIFTGALDLAHDELMIAGDLHIPSTNYPLLTSMTELALKHMHGPRRLLICGDLSNGDRDTHYSPLAPSISRQAELAMLEKTLDWLLVTFDEIYLTPGNHMRHRLMAALDADLTTDQIKRLFTPPHALSRVHFSWYDLVRVTSGGETFTVTHQYQYRQTKLSVANDLAQKYQTHIVAFHQHHTAKGIDKYGRYTIIDCGGLHEQTQMAYVQLVPSTLPIMNSGFVFLRDGAANLLTPYKSFTDWRIWGVKPPWLPPTPPTKRKRTPKPLPALALVPDDKKQPKRERKSRAA